MQIDQQKLIEYYQDAPEDISLADIDLGRLPKHVSIIMDGNGRWATQRGLDRAKGHVAGVDSLREAVTTSVRLGFDALSAVGFSDCTTSALDTFPFPESPDPKRLLRNPMTPLSPCYFILR